MFFLMKDGKIVEQGRHDELLARRGHYYDLWMRQYEDSAISKVWSESAGDRQ